MPRLFTDNAITTLATGITGVETEMTVAAGKGAGFPVVDGTDANYFVITMEDAAGELEFIRVDHRVGDVLGSVTYPNTRDYDGSSAQAWIADDTVDLRWTSASMNSLFLPTQDLIPETTDLYDIGSDSFRFQDLFLEGDIDTNGLVDGRDVGVDGVLLDTLNTGAYIKSLYEVEAKAYTDDQFDLLNAMYYVGFVIHQTVATNPAGLGMPGTWTQIGQGRVLIGEGSGAGLTPRTAAAELGDENSVGEHNHGVTDGGHGHGVTDPGHTHASAGAHTHNTTAGRWIGNYTDNGSAPDQRMVESTQATTSNGAHSHPSSTTGVSVQSGTTGVSIDNEGVTDGNMQPSLVVYIFERTA